MAHFCANFILTDLYHDSRFPELMSSINCRLVVLVILLAVATLVGHLPERQAAMHSFGAAWLCTSSVVWIWV